MVDVQYYMQASILGRDVDRLVYAKRSFGLCKLTDKGRLVYAASKIASVGLLHVVRNMFDARKIPRLIDTRSIRDVISSMQVSSEILKLIKSPRLVYSMQLAISLVCNNM